MFEIETVNGNDGECYVKELSVLWHDTFSDSYEYIDFFMKNQLKNSIIVFAKHNNRIVAAQYLLPLQAVEYSTGKNGYFLYALSVNKGYRNLGIGSALVKKACKIADDTNKFIILAPAEESLVNYYRKLHFIENVYVSCIKTSCKNNPCDFSVAQLKSQDFERLRNQHFNKLIKWPLKTLKYILQENSYAGGDNIYLHHENKEIYIIVRKLSNDVIVSESNISEFDRQVFTDYLAHKYETKTINWIIPHTKDNDCVLQAMTYGLTKDDYYFNHILN